MLEYKRLEMELELLFVLSASPVTGNYLVLYGLDLIRPVHEKRGVEIVNPPPLTLMIVQNVLVF